MISPHDNVDRLLQTHIEACLRGYPEHFEPIVEHFRTSIYNFVLRAVGDTADAEDISQEVFLSAYRYLHTYKPDYKLATWLFTIAHNTVKRHWRQKAGSDVPVEPEHLDRAGGRGPKQQVSAGTGDARDLPEAIDRAIGTLPPPDREVLLLHYFEQFSYREIAAMLDLTEPQVRMRLYRSRKKIRQKIKK